MTSAAGIKAVSETSDGVKIRAVTLSDGRELRYILARKRVKNVNFRPHSDGIIYVSANTRVPIAEIERFIAERAEYFFAAFERIRTREEAGEVRADSVKWLGREYPVRVIANSRECAVFEEDECRVFTQRPEEENITSLIERAVRVSFCALLEELNVEVRRTLKARGCAPPPTRIAVKDMSSRWGSNSYSKGHISMNIRLAPYPRETVLSVLWHEYAHYWHHDHSKRFYAFLLPTYPEYYKWNGLLK